MWLLSLLPKALEVLQVYGLPQVSRKAYQVGMKLARIYGLGFFDASGENALCYTWVNGRFILAHRGENIAV